VGHEGAIGHESASDLECQASDLEWQKSKPCDAGNCVEIAATDEHVLVRSSESPDARITLTRGEWADFLASAREGLLDRF
jgi:hypothetical protein